MAVNKKLLYWVYTASTLKDYIAPNLIDIIKGGGHSWDNCTKYPNSTNGIILSKESFLSDIISGATKIMKYGIHVRKISTLSNFVGMSNFYKINEDRIFLQVKPGGFIYFFCNEALQSELFVELFK